MDKPLPPMIIEPPGVPRLIANPYRPSPDEPKPAWVRPKCTLFVPCSTIPLYCALEVWRGGFEGQSGGARRNVKFAATEPHSSTRVDEKAKAQVAKTHMGPTWDHMIEINACKNRHGIPKMHRNITWTTKTHKTHMGHPRRSKGECTIISKHV